MTVLNFNVNTQSILGNSGRTTLTIGFTYIKHTQLVVFIQDETDPLNIVTTPLVFAPYDSMDTSVAVGRFKLPQPQDQPIGANWEHGPTVQINAALTVTQRLVINRVTPIAQEVSYDPSRPIPAIAVERQEDLQVMMIQEVASLATASASGTRGQMGLTGATGATGAGTPQQETPMGTINSVNVTFGLSQTPTSAAALDLYINGVYQRQGIEYTIAMATITMAVAPTTGSDIWAKYYY